MAKISENEYTTCTSNSVIRRSEAAERIRKVILRILCAVYVAITANLAGEMGRSARALLARAYLSRASRPGAREPRRDMQIVFVSTVDAHNELAAPVWWQAPKRRSGCSQALQASWSSP